MKLYYKLTDQNMKTRTGYPEEFQWELSKVYEIDKDLQGQEQILCSDAWFHVYSDSLLAILLNPIHANIRNPRLFRCTCSGLHKEDRGLKEGFTKIKLTSEMQIPKITIIQKIAFGILCAKKVFFKKEWVKWANNWLKNINRSACSAYAAAHAVADAAAHAVAHAAADAAADAAVYVAVYVANAVADAAAHAAVYVANAADAVAHTSTLNLALLARKAMKY